MLIIWMIWFVSLLYHVMKVNHDLQPEFNQGHADLQSAALTTELWTVSAIVCSVTASASCRVSSHRQMIFTCVSVIDLEAFLEYSDTWYNILITVVLDLSGNVVDITLRFIVIENTLANSNETMTKRIETAFIVHVERGIGENTQDNRMRVPWAWTYDDDVGDSFTWAMDTSVMTDCRPPMRTVHGWGVQAKNRGFC